MNEHNDALFRRNLAKRLDRMDAEMKDLRARIESLNQMVLHCVDTLETEFGGIDHEQSL
ncbi:hypothetical protein OLK001_08440 [Synechocystis sp. LKSZ1]